VSRLAHAVFDGGNAVTVYTNDPGTYSRYNFRTGIGIRASPRLGSGRVTKARSYAAIMRAHGFGSVDELLKGYKFWNQVFKEEGATTVICEHAPVALFSALVSRLDVHQVGTCFTVPPINTEAKLLSGSLGSPCIDTIHVDRVIASASQRLGGPRLNLSLFLSLPARWIMSWPILDHYQNRTDDNFSGAPTVQVNRKLERAEPIATYLYYPRTGPFATVLESALKWLDWPAVWVAPGLASSETIGRMRINKPDPFHLNRMSAETLCLYRGSHGTAVEAVQAGATSILLPDTVETVALSLRLERQGLGFVLPTKASFRLIADGLAKIREERLNLSLRKTAQRYVKGFKNECVVARFAAHVGRD